MTTDADIISLRKQSLRDFVNTARDGMTHDQNAIIDAIVMLEVGRRTQSEDYVLELRLVAEKYRKSSPYLSGLLKCLADVLQPLPGNVVPIFKTTPPGGKPCP
jgi:hypothetical protein